jgi:DNA-binding transcriptional LysR family regulator
MQNLEPIRIFVTVAEMGSFTRAADSLGIQKGRASTAVRKLEEDVGARLLHRTTRSVRLTEDGRAFHARARDLLAEVDDLHSMFAGDRVALRGRLRVDLPAEVARTTIVPALPDFMATHPELELEVSSTDRLVDLVQEGFDCVLRLGPIRDETLIARPLGLLRTVNAASPAYLARYGVPRSLEDLRRFFDDAGRKTLWMGISGWRHLRDASVAWRAVRQQRADLRSRCSRRPWPDSGAALGGWPIPRERSACGDYARFSSPGARRVLVVAHRSNLSRRVRAFMRWIEDVLTPYLE